MQSRSRFSQVHKRSLEWLIAWLLAVLINFIVLYDVDTSHFNVSGVVAWLGIGLALLFGMYVRLGWIASVVSFFHERAAQQAIEAGKGLASVKAINRNSLAGPITAIAIGSAAITFGIISLISGYASGDGLVFIFMLLISVLPILGGAAALIIGLIIMIIRLNRRRGLL